MAESEQFNEGRSLSVRGTAAQSANKTPVHTWIERLVPRRFAVANENDRAIFDTFALLRDLAGVTLDLGSLVLGVFAKEHVLQAVDIQPQRIQRTAAMEHEACAPEHLRSTVCSDSIIVLRGGAYGVRAQLSEPRAPPT